ncbi:hypothetical protein Adeg_0692 [Ammonifex degensii KC4]|uniref:Uncharacterized protein n=1 Tax=Ammonifex degensii (strain DSM 10501 / KC4) TaxID=429009 RepID=C9RC62_AMMDK|nr:hypothetical protein [Ammonifex degensii]ACX51839.1 hypothetical protein Adeg_0692 [Ammonifex degensii KC4]
MSLLEKAEGIYREAQELLKEYETALLEAVQVKEALAAAEELKKKVEARVLAEVASNGELKNESQRKAKLSELLEGNQEFQEAVSAASSSRKKLAQLEARAEVLKYRLRLAHAFLGVFQGAALLPAAQLSTAQATATQTTATQAAGREPAEEPGEQEQRKKALEILRRWFEKHGQLRVTDLPLLRKELERAGIKEFDFRPLLRHLEERGKLRREFLQSLGVDVWVPARKSA